MGVVCFLTYCHPSNACCCLNCCPQTVGTIRFLNYYFRQTVCLFVFFSNIAAMYCFLIITPPDNGQTIGTFRFLKTYAQQICRVSQERSTPTQEIRTTFNNLITIGMARFPTYSSIATCSYKHFHGILRNTDIRLSNMSNSESEPAHFRKL